MAGCYVIITTVMVIFEIALIILVAAPVIALAVYLYIQIASYVKQKNTRDIEKRSAGSSKSSRKTGRRR